MEVPEGIDTGQKVVCRRGAAGTLAGECAPFGARGLIVCGRSLVATGHRDRIAAACRGIVEAAWHVRSAADEPELAEITAVIAAARAAGALWIAGIGGGSVLDIAKAAAGLYHASREPGYYQAGGVLSRKGIPFIAVPTTAGTGSEATINAVITNAARRSKLSIRDGSFLARTVILDAELLEDIPRPAMVYAAMDAFVQAYESFISRTATTATAALALRALGLINTHIVPAVERRDPVALEGLLLGSYLCGAAFNISRLGVIHGLAHSLGALYHEPHGLICAVLLGPSIRLNREAMGEKYGLMSACLGQDLTARAAALVRTFGLASPFTGKEVIEREKIIAETLASGSTAANPRPVTRADVEGMLAEIF